ncbi:MAG TPA: trypsin-like peptidase domain-containing protein [Caulobacteraceae bacterium]|nr:trypsin-like peptidase domain-containing protein [Caulobacteraceae bacterium]
MRRPWLRYGVACTAIVLALFFLAVRRRDLADAPPPPPPLSPAEGAVLAQAAPIDPALVVRVTPDPARHPGVAFSVADRGLWLTARVAVEGCAKVAILIGGGEGVSAKVLTGPTGDVAALATADGAPALPLARQDPARGAIAFAPGFDAGRPAEVALRVLGPEALERRDRARPHADVEALAEIGRTEGVGGDLAELAGAPVLDDAGRVVGVILAGAPRRGRFYAARASALSQALAAAKVPASPSAAGLAFTVDNYGLAADDLRRSLRIAPVVCTAS